MATMKENGQPTTVAGWASTLEHLEQERAKLEKRIAETERAQGSVSLINVSEALKQISGLGTDLAAARRLLPLLDEKIILARAALDDARKSEREAAEGPNRQRELQADKDFFRWLAQGPEKIKELQDAAQAIAACGVTAHSWVRRDLCQFINATLEDVKHNAPELVGGEPLPPLAEQTKARIEADRQARLQRGKDSLPRIRLLLKDRNIDAHGRERIEGLILATEQEIARLEGHWPPIAPKIAQPELSEEEQERRARLVEALA